jgi:exodeoxyribonuclease-3
MLLATWNVNSVRARLDRLVAFLGRWSPDVVCLQELKVPDEDFPLEAIHAAGYQAAILGQRTYNGVAILSRVEAGEIQVGFGDGDADQQARFIAATVGGVRVASAYIPNGQVVGSDKWAYKLDWLGRLRAWLDRHTAVDQPLALCGDFNVAPEDRDAARPDEWRDSVLCHEDARRALHGVTSWGLTDAIRLHDEGPGPFSWWDYRMLAFPKGNGLRIDHIFLTAPLAARCTSATVDREERKGKQPSDHAPVLVTLE